MVDLKLTSKSSNFSSGFLDVRFDSNGNLETLENSQEIYLQNLMKASLDRYRETVHYGVDITSFRGQKNSSVIRSILQDRMVNTICFMNRYYPISLKLRTINLVSMNTGLLLRVVLDQDTLELAL